MQRAMKNFGIAVLPKPGGWTSAGTPVVQDGNGNQFRLSHDPFHPQSVEVAISADRLRATVCYIASNDKGASHNPDSRLICWAPGLRLGDQHGFSSRNECLAVLARDYDRSLPVFPTTLQHTIRAKELLKQHFIYLDLQLTHDRGLRQVGSAASANADGVICIPRNRAIPWHRRLFSSTAEQTLRQRLQETVEAYNDFMGGPGLQVCCQCFDNRAEPHAPAWVERHDYRQESWPCSNNAPVRWWELAGASSAPWLDKLQQRCAAPFFDWLHQIENNCSRKKESPSFGL